MTVKEMKEYLDQFPEDAECYFSVWMSDGEHRFRTKIINDPERNLSENKKYVRITWVDNCMANHILEREIGGGGVTS